VTAVPIGILATGGYVPDRVVTNEEICALVPDATPDWILSRTGIVTRRYAAPDQATSDLAARAAGRALAAAGVTAGEVDYLIVSTSTGDSPQPPTACGVQDLIGARNAACLDINVVCSGFVYGLEIARGLLGVNPGTRALVIGADVYSRCLDYRDRRTSVLLGDGAGAVLVGSVPAPGGFGEICLSSYGDARDLIGVAAGGSRLPASASTVAGGQHFFTMRGRAVRDFVLDNIPPLVDKLLSRAGLGPGDVGCFVPHQANGRLIGELAERCGLGGVPMARVVERYGNLGSASVPVALDDAVRSGAVAGGDVVLLAGFGGGMAAGAGLVRWFSPSSSASGRSS
jgi:acetoacetyl-CoA synthase